MISANLNVRSDNGSPGIVFNVTRGPAASDLIVTGGILNANGGTPGIILNGNGIMALAGANTYLGATTISGGTLQLGTGQSGQDGSIADTSGVTNNSWLTYNLFGNQSASYIITGTGNLTKLGPGQLTLAGNNSYTGTTTVAGGVLNVNGGDTSAAMSVTGGSLYVNVFSSATSVTVAGVRQHRRRRLRLPEFRRRQRGQWRHSRFRRGHQQHVFAGQRELRGQQHAQTRCAGELHVVTLAERSAH